MISTHCTSASFAKMNCSSGGDPIICDIAHATKNAFSDSLHLAPLTLLNVLDIGGGQLALMSAKLWNDHGVVVGPSGTASRVRRAARCGERFIGICANPSHLYR